MRNGLGGAAPPHGGAGRERGMGHRTAGPAVDAARDTAPPRQAPVAAPPRMDHLVTVTAGLVIFWFWLSR
ncbi:hypothetical protein GCM10023334_095950 [Nonomuraea thailandensis]